VQENGYVIHQTADLGGHIVGVSGSGAMYDTLVNLHSGPRVLGQTFTMHALPGHQAPLMDSLSAFSNGFGGDPINFAKLSFSKGKLYEFSGTFRRDRQYFDYDLLAIPAFRPESRPLRDGRRRTDHCIAGAAAGQSIACDVQHRAQDDGHQPDDPAALEGVSFRVGYSQNIFQGRA
jgi:hypothetical protein